MSECQRCGLSVTSTDESFILPCPSCGWTPEVLTQEDINYLADFIGATLANNDETDPFDTNEADYLLELKRKLRNMGAKRI